MPNLPPIPGLFARLTGDLAGDMRALSLSGKRARGALRTALAAVLATLVALALHLDNPWWAAITGVVIVQPDAAATLSRSIDRVIGTTIGAAIGFLGAALIVDHLLFLALVAGCTGFVIYAQERAAHGYAFLLGGITVVLVMFGSLAVPGAALHLAVYRALEIYVGVGVACAVDYALAAPAVLAAVPARPGIWTPPLDRELASIAAAGGIAIAFIPLIWEALDLPGLGQTPITAFVILTAMRQEPVWRGLTRLAGCAIGALWGLAAMHLVGSAFLPWLAMLFVGLFVAAQIFHGGGDASYVGMQAGIAIVIAMIQGEGPSPDILPAVNRLIGIFGGVLVVSVCHPLLAPPIRRLIEPRP